jgi:hypothetical protein
MVFEAVFPAAAVAASSSLSLKKKILPEYCAEQ